MPSRTRTEHDAMARRDRTRRALSEGLASDVRKLIKDGNTIEEAVATAGQSERGKWQLFDEHHPHNVTAAFTELEWE